MTIKFAKWKRVLSTVNGNKDLSKDSVIEKIQEKLRRFPKDYNRWEKDNFNIDYLFRINSDYNNSNEEVAFVTFAEEFLPVRYGLLHLATYIDCEHLAKALIEKNAKVDVIGSDGSTPLLLAAKLGNIKLAKVFIENGANVNVRNECESEDTPLHCAVCFGHIEVAKTLIKNGANVDAVNKNGNTPLGLATQENQVKLIKILKESGTNIDEVNKNVYIPLGCAIQNYNKEVEASLDDIIKESLKEKEKIQQVTKNVIIAGGTTALLGTVIAAALLATEAIAIPIIIAVVAVTAAALVVGGATYMLLKPSIKVDEAVLTNVHEISVLTAS